MDHITDRELKKPVHAGHFNKGAPSPNPAGRPKGMKSKKNQLLDDFMIKVVAIGADRYIEQLMRLEGKAFTDTYATAFEFVRGKIARTELAVAPGEGTKRQVLNFDGQEFEF